MKRLIKISICLFLFVPCTLFAQKTKILKDFTASNGIAYHEGDTIKLSRGSSQDGSFLYVQIGGWATNYSNVNANNLSRQWNGLNVIVKKIRSVTWRGATKVMFVVGGGNITNYNLMIEDAIATCEIVDCKKIN